MRVVYQAVYQTQHGTVMTLQIRDIEALGPGVHQIGPRLYLKCVQREKGLSRHVLLRWTSGKRAEVKSLGAWQPELYGHFLAEARRAAEAKEQDRDVRLAMDERGAPGTFKEAAEGYMAANLPAFTNAKHRKRWRKLMEGTYATLGHLKVTQLEPGHIAKVLSPYWQRTPVQVMRVRSMIEQVIDYAIARANLNCRNVATLSVVRHLMPRRPRRQVKNMRAMAYEDVPALFKALASECLASSEALRFVILTASRSTEVRLMTWPEVDLGKAVWTLPPGRTKMFKAHRVPLNAPALAILAAMKERRQEEGDYVFHGDKPGEPYSHNMLRHAMKRVGFDEQGTPHGLRAAFKDWCRETQKFEWEAVELCLAHEVGSDVERAYGRSDLLHLRVPIMEAWGRLVSGEPATPAASAEVVVEKSEAENRQKKGRVLRLVA